MVVAFAERRRRQPDEIPRRRSSGTRRAARGATGDGPSIGSALCWCASASRDTPRFRAI
ncbi:MULTISPECIES: hypothetical protein [unclassified Burkholderia]|uniref:hypothetical protein n=1 Tax=unclassified Burkholderia TaxID=2613784 RepID=UPI000A45C497|nr:MULTISPECIES: hypothetical protein [unclassified Burkholderia]